jgi:hypothetical protein
MDYCFSSICPNDLINNLDDFSPADIAKPDSTDHNKYSFGSSSSTSSSFSSSSSSSSPNIEQMKPTGIVSYEYTPFLTEATSDFTNPGLVHSAMIKPLSNNADIQQTMNNYQLSSLNTSQTCSIISPSASIDFGAINKDKGIDLNNIFHQSSVFQIENVQNKPFGQNSYLIKEMSKEESLHLNNSSSVIVSTKLPKMNANPIVLVESNKSSTKKSIQNALANQKNSLNNSKKPTILPPSPPSSFGSDSESDHSSNNPSVITEKGATISKTINTLNSSIKMISGSANSASKTSTVSKSNAVKANSTLRSATTIKQIRHQPYSIKSSLSNPENSNKSHSKAATAKNKENQDNEMSLSDDECWPFLCSLSVSFYSFFHKI